jgi:hypothetical protein
VIVGLDRIDGLIVPRLFRVDAGLEVRAWHVDAAPGHSRRLYEINGQTLNNTPEDRIVATILRLGEPVSPWRGHRERRAA